MNSSFMTSRPASFSLFFFVLTFFNSYDKELLKIISVHLQKSSLTQVFAVRLCHVAVILLSSERHGMSGR